MKKITRKELLDFVSWLEYEHSLTTEYDRKDTFEDLENSSRIFNKKYAVLLKKLGFKGMADFHK